MTTNRNRQQQIADFYAQHAERLRSAVSRRTGARDEHVDDACQTAWAQLLARPDIHLNWHGFSWLVIVATHEAWRLRARREQPAGAFIGFVHSDQSLDAVEYSEPADADTSSAEDRALDRIEHQQRVAALKELKPNDRQALILHGLGYSYKEIMQLTSASYTAVNRRLAEGRAALGVRRLRPRSPR